MKGKQHRIAIYAKTERKSRAGYDGSEYHAEGFPEGGMQEPAHYCADTTEDGHPVNV